MPEALKTTIDALCAPPILFALAVALLGVFLLGYRILTAPVVALGAAALAAAWFLLSLGDADFRRNAAEPDNVAIWIMLVSVGFFLWLSFRQAARNDARLGRGEPPLEATEQTHVLVWPDLVTAELIAALLCTAGLIVWSCLLRAPLEAPADPVHSPNPAKAPWYFLGVQELLVYFDAWIAGVLLPCCMIAGMIAVPYLDPNPRGRGYYTFRERPLAITIFLFGFVILWIVPIILGTFLRGPNWNAFGPYESWDVHKLEPLVNVNLSELVWSRGIGTGLPRNVLGSRFLGIVCREAPGLLAVTTYLGFLPVLLARTVFRRLRADLGPVRYAFFSVLFLVMLSLPVKMLLRWLCNVKYVVAMPEYVFNI
jgi:hypothetical protein